MEVKLPGPPSSMILCAQASVKYRNLDSTFTDLYFLAILDLSMHFMHTAIFW